MLDGFLVIFLAVAVPAYLIVWIVGNARVKQSNREREESRELTEKWSASLPASSDDIRRVTALASYNPDGGNIIEQIMPTPEKMAAYYFDKLGLAEDFCAIYGHDWREKVQIIPDPDDFHHKGFSPRAIWHVEGFLKREQADVEKAIAAILLSREGKVMSSSTLELNITAVPSDRAPWANRWFARIEENLRSAGRNVDLYIAKEGNRGAKPGAYFAPGPYLTKLDEQEENNA